MVAFVHALNWQFTVKIKYSINYQILTEHKNTLGLHIARHSIVVVIPLKQNTHG